LFPHSFPKAFWKYLWMILFITKSLDSFRFWPLFRLSNQGCRLTIFPCSYFLLTVVPPWCRGNQCHRPAWLGSCPRRFAPWSEKLGLTMQYRFTVGHEVVIYPTLHSMVGCRMSHHWVFMDFYSRSLVHWKDFLFFLYYSCTCSVIFSLDAFCYWILACSPISFQWADFNPITPLPRCVITHTGIRIFLSPLGSHITWTQFQGGIFFLIVFLLSSAQLVGFIFPS